MTERRHVRAINRSPDDSTNVWCGSVALTTVLNGKTIFDDGA
jgi:hypothetical protein